MPVSDEIMSTIASTLQERFGFSTTTQLDRAVADMVKRIDTRLTRGSSSDFSISRVIRGLSAEQGKIVNRDTASGDLEYAKKALGTGTVPGQYLVPTIQSADLISILTVGGVARSSGVRVWDMTGIQKMTIPAATAFPTVEFINQNSTQSASDPNLGQVSFDLKTRRALVVFPLELLKSSVPSYDAFLTELLGQAFAEHEDTIFFAATAASGGPTPFYATAGVTSVMVNSSVNGGNIAYSDIVNTLKAAYSAKLTGNLAWYCSPRTFFGRILNLLDLVSRPIIVADPTAAAPARLFGWPINIVPNLPENLANGSGTNQSYMLLTNPKRCLHIAQSSGIEVGVTLERYFENNQCGVRVTQGIDLAACPAAGVCILKGINWVVISRDSLTFKLLLVGVAARV